MWKKKNYLLFSKDYVGEESFILIDPFQFCVLLIPVSSSQLEAYNRL